MEILATHYFADRPSDSEFDSVLRSFRDRHQPDALVYCGFGLHSEQLNPSLARIGWDPPKVMNAAIMWALASPQWAEALDGWIGIEQTLSDHDNVEKNRNWGPLLDRHRRRFGYRPDHTMTALLYDQGRAAVEATVNALDETGPGLAAGLERTGLSGRSTPNPDGCHRQ